jgi:hypothetical protein
MKRLLTILALTTLIAPLWAQVEESNTASDNNCSSIFYSVNLFGEVQQWSLLEDTVVGGETILNNMGRSIAYCGANNSSFYSVPLQNKGILYQDENGDWINLPTDVKLVNVGGHGNDIYYMGSIEGKNRILFYFNGKTLIPVETFTGNLELSSADIPVDYFGRAWVLVGESSTKSSHINVYDQNGLVNTYSLEFDSEHIYGAFFLNQVLYLGMGTNGLNPNTLTPVIINGNEAKLGSPISFNGNNLHDMASCNQTSRPHSLDLDAIADLTIFPNPSKGIFTIETDQDILSVEIFDAHGKLVVSQVEDNTIDLSEAAAGHYYVKIKTPIKEFKKTLIKIN